MSMRYADASNFSASLLLLSHQSSIIERVFNTRFLRYSSYSILRVSLSCIYLLASRYKYKKRKCLEDVSKIGETSSNTINAEHTHVKILDKTGNSLKECLIVFTGYFTAWPLAKPMAIEGMNLVIAGGVQWLLVHRRCIVHFGSPAWSYRIQNACDNSESERRIRKNKTRKRETEKTGELEIEPREASNYYFYHSIRSCTLTHWSCDGTPEYPTALTSMTANCHQAANLLERRGRKNQPI